MNNTNANGVNVSGQKNNDQYILTLEQIAKVLDLSLPIVEELARTQAVGA